MHGAAQERSAGTEEQRHARQSRKPRGEAASCAPGDASPPAAHTPSGHERSHRSGAPALTVAAAAAIAQTGIDAGQDAIALAVFVVIGTFGVVTPLVIFFVLGERSRKPLDELKSWMAAHNAAIMAVITLVIGVKLLGDGISGL